MKFFKWLGKSREWEELYPSLKNPKSIDELLQSNHPKPSPTTFYPPIEERKDQLNIHEGKACRCQKCLSEIDISTSASEGSVGFVSISEED